MADGRHTAVLRGIAHARLYVSAGDGLETVITRLAKSHCGWVSKRFEVLRRKMIGGKTAPEVLGKELQSVERKTKKRGYALLLGALLAEGEQVDQRLASATQAVLDDADNQVAKNTDRARFFSKLTATAMVTCFFPPLLGFIMARAKGYVALPEPDPALSFAVSGVLIASCAFLMSGRE